MPVPLRPKRPNDSHFYKYSSAEHLDRLEATILRHELYFPTSIQLNDPADGKPKLAKCSLDQIARFLLEKFVDNNPGLPDQDYVRAAMEIAYNTPRLGTDVLLREMAKCLNSELETVRIYSLSRRYDNMSLWAKYAANHTGYCLEFINEGLFSFAYEVSYDETVTMNVTDPEQVNANFLFYKSKEWSNEEEVRIVAPRGSQAIIQFDPKLLTRIILGKNMAESHRKKILDLVEQRPYKLTIVSTEFDELEQRLIVRA
jgi:hypothetical protein